LFHVSTLLFPAVRSLSNRLIPSTSIRQILAASGNGISVNSRLGALLNSADHVVCVDAYYCADTVDELATVDDVELLKNLKVPHQLYTCARTSRAREAAIRSQTAAPTAGGHNRATHILPPYSYHPPDDQDRNSSSSSDTSSSDESSSPSMSPTSKLSSLAPLEYLETIPRLGRHPMDDHALRLFDSVHSVQKIALVRL